MGPFIAVFAAYLWGTDYEYGTLRNKLICGHTREEVYFSNLLLTICAGLSTALIWLIVNGMLGIPLLGTASLNLSLGEMAFYIFSSLLMVVALSSVCCLLASLAENKNSATLLCLGAVAAMVIIGMLLYDRFAEPELLPAISIHEKLARAAAIEEINSKTREHFSKLFEENPQFTLDEIEQNKKYVDLILEHILAEEVRRLITNDKIRPDGRAVNEIRPLSSRIDIFERTHGSALFTRGQTQSLSVVTLGSLTEFQIIDGLGVEDSKRFMLHYNFPQFAVGSTGRYGSPGRREIGHGALGERALLQVIPSEDEFPYTIRIVSEILESNGSSSQASICAGTMALMAAGVPIQAPVAGIAMGLISQDDECSKYTILTDIQGLEDHYGDMDFKVAGTKTGITALQMDIKIKGITPEILKEALAQAKVGRMQILDHMLTTISEVRPKLSQYAPKVRMIRINPERIRDVIGSGGKIIQEIIDKCNDVKIDIEQDGRVFVMHAETKWIDEAIKIIENLTREPVVGEIYPVRVVKIVDFGAFVELWPGCEGLVHISELDTKRVAKVEDVVHVDDEIVVKLLKIDDKGKLVLSRKVLLKQTQKTENEEKTQALHEVEQKGE